MAFLKGVRGWARRKVEGVVSEGIDSPAVMKYVPYTTGRAFIIPKDPDRVDSMRHRDLPIPPKTLYAGYADNPEKWVRSGEDHVAKMLELLADTGFTPKPGDRILDYGCAAGRMIRCLSDLAAVCEIWGVDITAEAIYWCQRHLSPPFRFATTTMLPHLPFEDRYFTMLYAGSIFTHLDDLAMAWLLELRRVLAPGGRAFLTVNDYHSLEVLEERYPHLHLTKQMWASGLRRAGTKPDFGMFVLNRSREWWLHTFYDIDFFCTKMLAPAFRILSVTEEAYAFQTAVIVERR